MTGRHLLAAAVLLPVVAATAPVRPGALSMVAALACGALAVASVLGARRLPDVAVGAVLAAWVLVFVGRVEIDNLVGVGALGPAVIAVSVLAGRSVRSGRVDGAVLAVAPAAAAAGAVLGTAELDTALAAFVGVVVLTVVPWALGRRLRSHDELVRAGWDRAHQWERIAEQAEQAARRRERDRLAAEMHDLIGHELARVALGVGAWEVDPGLDGDRRAAAGRVREGVTAAAERLADVVRVLRTDPDAAGPSTITEIVDGARLSGVDVVVDGIVEPRDPVIAETVRRVLAEALTNAMTHAPGAAVRVSVAEDTTSVLVRVENTAGGAAGSHPGGAGLVGLTERVRLVGGRIDAGPVADGWCVTATLPATPAAPAPPGTAADERRAVARVARSGRWAVGAGLAVAVLTATLVGGAMIVDAATSVLDPADYDRLVVGTPRADVDAVLPWRTRTDDPDTGVPDPSGATCEHYSTNPDPFGPHRGDLHRLCFADGVLVDKALLVRGRDGSATVVR